MKKEDCLTFSRAVFLFVWNRLNNNQYTLKKTANKRRGNHVSILD